MVPAAAEPDAAVPVLTGEGTDLLPSVLAASVLSGAGAGVEAASRGVAASDPEPPLPAAASAAALRGLGTPALPLPASPTLALGLERAAAPATAAASDDSAPEDALLGRPPPLAERPLEAAEPEPAATLAVAAARSASATFIRQCQSGS